MGLFSSKPAPELPSTDGVDVPDWLLEKLPSPHGALLNLYDNPETKQVVAAELDRVRFPTGGFDTRGASPAGKHGGPLSLLSWITTGDWIAVQVWATSDLPRSTTNAIKGPIQSLVSERGVPYAVTWAMIARGAVGAEPKPVEILAGMLENGYREWLGKITNGMVIDSIRKWRR